MPTSDQIRDALNHLNWNYGRGEITEVSAPDLKGNGYFVRRIPTTNTGGFTENRPYRLIGRTVKALRHQRTVPSN